MGSPQHVALDVLAPVLRCELPAPGSWTAVVERAHVVAAVMKHRQENPPEDKQGEDSSDAAVDVPPRCGTPMRLIAPHATLSTSYRIPSLNGCEQEYRWKSERGAGGGICTAPLAAFATNETNHRRPHALIPLLLQGAVRVCEPAKLSAGGAHVTWSPGRVAGVQKTDAAPCVTPADATLALRELTARDAPRLPISLGLGRVAAARRTAQGVARVESTGYDVA